MKSEVKFQPPDGYAQGVNWTAHMWCLLFGPLWLAYRGIWKHVLLWVLAGIVMGSLGGIKLAIIPTIFYFVMAPKILEKHYMQKGWKRVGKDKVTYGWGRIAALALISYLTAQTGLWVAEAEQQTGTLEEIMREELEKEYAERLERAKEEWKREYGEQILEEILKEIGRDSLSQAPTDATLPKNWHSSVAASAQMLVPIDAGRA